MSTETTCREELVDHFNRTWDMVIEAAERFSDANWASPDDHRYTPARVVYHLLETAERYTYTGDPKEFDAQRRLKKNWTDSPIAELPSRGQCLTDLRATKASTVSWLSAAGAKGLTGSPPTWPWVGQSLLGQTLYLLRHTQHHQAELNQALKRLDLQPVRWK